MTSATHVLHIPVQRRLGGVRIVLVEDHALLVESFRIALTAEGAEVHVPPLSGAEAIIDTCLALHSDLVLLDLSLGEVAGDGRALIEPLVAGGARVVMLTGSTDDAALGDCIARGAVGVIGKNEPLNAVVDRLRLASNGERILPAQRHFDLLTAGRRQRQARSRELGPFDMLTPREADVLDDLMHGRSVDQIASRHYLSTTTVRTHVRGVLVKLGVRSQLAAVARAVEAGWSRAATQADHTGVQAG